jgi:hypothetical protein
MTRLLSPLLSMAASANRSEISPLVRGSVRGGVAIADIPYGAADCICGNNQKRTPSYVAVLLRRSTCWQPLRPSAVALGASDPPLAADGLGMRLRASRTAL